MNSVANAAKILTMVCGVVALAELVVRDAGPETTVRRLGGGHNTILRTNPLEGPLPYAGCPYAAQPASMVLPT